MSSFFRKNIFLGPFLLLLVDRLLKSSARLSAEHGGVELVPGILEFRFFANEGIAFSIPFSGPAVWVLSFLIVILITAWILPELKKRHAFAVFSYAIFILGTASNLFDRIAYGYTIDYFIFFGRSAVNIADGLIILGVLLLVMRPQGDRNPTSPA